MATSVQACCLPIKKQLNVARSYVLTVLLHHRTLRIFKRGKVDIRFSSRLHIVVVTDKDIVFSEIEPAEEVKDLELVRVVRNSPHFHDTPTLGSAGKTVRPGRGPLLFSRVTRQEGVGVEEIWQRREKVISYLLGCKRGRVILHAYLR